MDQSKRDSHRQWPADLKARIVSEGSPCRDGAGSC